MTLPRKLAPPPRWLTVGSTLALLLILCGAILLLRVLGDIALFAYGGSKLTGQALRHDVGIVPGVERLSQPR